MSQAAGASVDRGVLAAGINYLAKEFSIGAVNYFCDDIINILYAEGKYNHTFGNQLGLLFAAQYSDQRSTGSNLLTGASFFTNQVGLKSEVGCAGGLLTVAYTVDAAGAELRNPWSGYPGYTSVQVEDFNSAREQAFLVRLAYDFTRTGGEGLTAAASMVHGWNRWDPGTRDAVREDEYDVDLQWRPKRGALKGFWPRVRYAHVDQRNGSAQSADDFRVILNYEISLL